MAPNQDLTAEAATLRRDLPGRDDQGRERRVRGALRVGEQRIVAPGGDARLPHHPGHPDVQGRGAGDCADGGREKSWQMTCDGRS